MPDRGYGNRPQQLFARGQGQPLQNGPFLGGAIYVLASPVTAGASISIAHNIRCVPRHIEVVQTISGEYPSRLAITAATSASMNVQFESAQSAGSKLFFW